MHWEPDDNDAILRAGRWATGSLPAHPPAPELEPDLEAEIAEDELEPIALDPPRAPASSNPTRGRAIALALTLVVLAGAAGFVTTWFVLDERATPAPDALSDGATLDGLIVQQSDLGFADEVVPLRGGSDAVNEPTLNLCNGSYPTESERVARRQVAVVGVDGSLRLSTEAVTYRDIETSQEAFNEIQRETARCPKTPVPNNMGTGSEATRFNAPPDTGWQDTPGVDRLAYDLERTDQTGTKDRSIVVYLRRGRALMGVYFYVSGQATQPSVRGRTNVEDIVSIFASRLADLPQAAVNGPTR